MRTRFTQLVKYKKNEMQKCERELTQARDALQSAQEKLEYSYSLLNNLQIPQNGTIEEFLQSRTSLSLQRNIILKNKEDVMAKNSYVESAKEQLKVSMIDYEKFKYLETQQVDKILKKQKMAEEKALDEAAIQTYIGRMQ